MISVPLFADHLYRLGHCGAQSVFEALTKLLNDVSYHTKALRIKEKLQSHPFRPQERFIKWIEFSAEFPDLSELNFAGAELNAFVYHSLDVIVPILLAIVILLYI